MRYVRTSVDAMQNHGRCFIGRSQTGYITSYRHGTCTGVGRSGSSANTTRKYKNFTYEIYKKKSPGKPGEPGKGTMEIFMGAWLILFGICLVAGFIAALIDAGAL